MVGAAAVEDMSRIFLAFGGLWCGSRGFRGVVGRDTDAVEGVPEFGRVLNPILMSPTLRKSFSVFHLLSENQKNPFSEPVHPFTVTIVTMYLEMPWPRKGRWGCPETGRRRQLGWRGPRRPTSISPKGTCLSCASWAAPTRRLPSW